MKPVTFIFKFIATLVLFIIMMFMGMFALANSMLALAAT